MSPSTAPRSRRRRPITRRAATSRSPRGFSRRPPERSGPRTRSTARPAVMSCPRGCGTSDDRRKWLREAEQALEAERAAQAKPVSRSRPERLAECKRGLEERAGSLSAGSSKSMRPGTRAGSRATAGGGWPAPARTSNPTRWQSNRAFSPGAPPEPKRPTAEHRRAAEGSSEPASEGRKEGCRWCRWRSPVGSR
jgi:hypothetical protein